MNIYWKTLICGSLNQWFVRDDRCSQKHLTGWGLSTVVLTTWKCYKCQWQAVFYFSCISLFRHCVAVSCSDLYKIASGHVQCGFLCLPLPIGNRLLSQIFPFILEWGTLIKRRKPELVVWTMHSFCLRKEIFRWILIQLYLLIFFLLRIEKKSAKYILLRCET